MVGLWSKQAAISTPKCEPGGVCPAADKPRGRRCPCARAARDRLSNWPSGGGFAVVLVLFVVSLAVLAGFLGLAFHISRDADRKEGSGPSDNQWRLIAWVVAILAALVAAVVEFFVVVK